ncbi:vWA domain-containing protein [Chitinophaga varians]|uniref:vWA domain-containing protein n=1 Tax=Chitinophaga varians TaxID=2202339 RepID=UPI00165FC59C|nr:VWA domain-containing protein [Chitinophaga varians]MBC9908984.1 VWA domain-containing protein [Chitinophaga varians]
MEQYLFQSGQHRARIPIKSSTQAGRKGMPLRLPTDARVIANKTAGAVMQRDLPATILHYLLHGRCEIRYRRIQQVSALRLIMVIDSSASMALHQQVGMAKGIITDMMRRYQYQHPQVAIVAMLHGQAPCVLPFSGDMDTIQNALAQLHTGGKTNLRAAFDAVRSLVKGQLDSREHHLFIFTDGRVNTGGTLEEAAAFFKAHLSKLKKHTSVLDTETGMPRLGMAVRLSKLLGCKRFEPGTHF